MPIRCCHAAVFLLAFPAIAQVQSAADLLAKAQDAFAQNLKRETHWNWTTTETTSVLDSAGRESQRLPAVTVESVIRQDGRRCTAVVAWGDGVPPYKLKDSAEARCSGQDPVEPPLRVAPLLRSAKASLVESSPDFFTVAIHHDKARVRDPQPEIRCTASVEGVVRLDRATLFPVHLEGKVVDSGCESETVTELHYGEAPLTQPSRRALFKGTTFRMEFTLQFDKYGNPANSYWLSTGQNWVSPIGRASGVVYHNRRFPLSPVWKSGFLVKDQRTSAQEFGAQSLTRFDSVPK